MAISGKIFENRKKENLYANYDNNVYALAEVAIETIKFLENEHKEGRVSENLKSFLLNQFKLGNVQIPNRTEEETKRYKFLLSRIELTDSIRYAGETVIPRDELAIYDEIGTKFKNYLGFANGSNINIRTILEGKLASVIEYKLKPIEELNFDSIESLFAAKPSNGFDVSDVIARLTTHLESNVIRFEMNGSDKVYIEDKNVLGEKTTLTIGDMVNLFPVLKSGYEIEIPNGNSSTNETNVLKVDVLNTSEAIRLLLNNNFSNNEYKKGVENQNDPSREIKARQNFKKYSYGIWKESVGLDKIIDTLKKNIEYGNHKGNAKSPKVFSQADCTELKKHLLLWRFDKLIEIKAFEKYMEKDDASELITKINSNYDIAFTRINAFSAKMTNSLDEASTKEIKSFLVNLINGVENQTFVKDFYNRASKLKILVNEEILKDDFEFNSDYQAIKSFVDSFFQKEENLYGYYGSAGIGKTYNLEKLIKLFGGTYISQKEVLTIGAMNGFSQGGYQMSASGTSRTVKVADLWLNFINGRTDKMGFVLMDEFGSTLDNVLKANSINIPGLLGPLEALSDSNKFLPVEVFGKPCKVRTNGSVVVLTGNNFSVSLPEINRRVKLLVQDASAFASVSHVKNMIETTIYESKLKTYLNNFTNDYDFSKKLGIITNVLIEAVKNCPNRNEMLSITMSNASLQDKIRNLSTADATYLNKTNQLYLDGSAKLKDPNITDKDKKEIEVNIGLYEQQKEYRKSSKVIKESEKFIYMNEFFELTKSYNKYLKENNNDPLVATEYLRNQKAVETLFAKNGITNINVQDEIKAMVSSKVQLNDDYKIDFTTFQDIARKFDLGTSNNLTQIYKTLDIEMMYATATFVSIDSIGELTQLKRNLIEAKALPSNLRDISINAANVERFLPFENDYLPNKDDSEKSHFFQDEKVKSSLALGIAAYNKKVNETVMTKLNAQSQQGQITFASKEAKYCAYGQKDIFYEIMTNGGIINTDVLAQTTSLDTGKFLDELEKQKFLKVENANNSIIGITG